MFGNLHLAGLAMARQTPVQMAQVLVFGNVAQQSNSIQIVFGNTTPNVVIAISSNTCRASDMGNADSPTSAKEPLPPLPFSGAIAGQEE